MKPHLQCAEQQVSRSNLTKYCACHAERLTYLVLITYETSFTVRGATGVTIQPHQILRLPRKIALQNFWQNLWKQMKRHFQCGDDPRMIREWSEHDPSMIRPWKRKPQPASQVRLLFELPRSIFYCKIQRFEPNLTFKHSPSAAPATKSNTWPPPNTAPTTKSNTWTSPNTAPTTKSNTWTSPSIAPATKSDTHSSSSWHMKPHLQCAEQPMSPSKLTKYCACHAKWPLNIWQKFAENRWNFISNAGTIREWSENDPSMIRAWSDHENANRNPPRKWGLLFELPRSIFYCKIQRFEPNLTFKHSPSAAPATKSNTWPSPNTAPTTKSNTWTSPNIAPTTKSNTWTSPSTAPATKSDIWTSPTLLLLTLVHLTYSTWFFSTWHYSTWHYSTWLYSTWFYSTWHYSTWPTLLDSTLLDTTLLDLLYLTLLYLTLLYLSLVHLTYSTWFYSTWHYSTWHYSTWLYSTWFYSTCFYSTWHYSTWLYSTWHYSTWHYSTWL